MTLQPPSDSHVKILGKFLTATLLMAAGLSVTALGRNYNTAQALLPISVEESVVSVAEKDITPDPNTRQIRRNFQGIANDSTFLDTCGGMLVILGLICLKEGLLDSQAPRTQIAQIDRYPIDPYIPDDESSLSP